MIIEPTLGCGFFPAPEFVVSSLSDPPPGAPFFEYVTSPSHAICTVLGPVPSVGATRVPRFKAVASSDNPAAMYAVTVVLVVISFVACAAEDAASAAAIASASFTFFIVIPCVSKYTLLVQLR